MKYFGTDGIRGVPNKELSLEFVNKVGRAIKCLNCEEVVIGFDTRLSKDMLSFALASGIMSSGMNVNIIGVISTPGLIYYCYKHNVVGVMISASHNPYFDNGLKIINRGFKLTEDEEENIEKLIDNPVNLSSDLGILVESNNALNEYQKFLSKYVKKTNLSVCLDFANGSSYMMKNIFNNVSDKVYFEAYTPNGININNDVGSTNIHFLKEKVLKNNCDIGFAFDGDGDRIIAVDNNGIIYDGDLLIYIIAKYLKSKKLLKNNTVALSIMSDLGLIKDLKNNDIDVIETPVGDKYIFDALNKYDLSLGGESSGHIILNNEFHSGDGVLVALFILNILNETNTNLSDWIGFKKYESSSLNLQVVDKEKIMENQELFELVNKMKYELNNDCKIIIRPSGTENLLRLMVMCKNKELADNYLKKLIIFIKENA